MGKAIRNRTFQLRHPRVRELKYLDIGCGRNVNPHFVNLDYLWQPDIDLCWDITRGLPFESASIKGIFSEHCLEHFPLPTAAGILRECRRILMPGGILRIVVPDGQLYLDTYHHQMAGDEKALFPYQAIESFEGLYSPILSVNRIFYQDRESPQGHCFIYDFQFLAKLLRYCGFDSVKRRAFQDSADPFLSIDTEIRSVESLYAEAMVTAGVGRANRSVEAE